MMSRPRFEFRWELLVFPVMALLVVRSLGGCELTDGWRAFCAELGFTTRAEQAGYTRLVMVGLLGVAIALVVRLSRSK